VWGTSNDYYLGKETLSRDERSGRFKEGNEKAGHASNKSYERNDFTRWRSAGGIVLGGKGLRTVLSKGEGERKRPRKEESLLISRLGGGIDNRTGFTVIKWSRGEGARRGGGAELH